MTESRLSCELHDYVEIACLRGYRVRLTLTDGQTVIGRALDTQTTAEKREYLIVDDGQKRSVELIRIATLEVLTPNASFKEIRFGVQDF